MDNRIKYRKNITSTININRTFGALYGSYSYAIDSILPINISNKITDNVYIKSSNAECFLEFGLTADSKPCLWVLSYTSKTSVSITFERVVEGYI